MAAFRLRLPDGEERRLPASASQQVTLGRRDLRPDSPGVAMVAREQCRLFVLPAAEEECGVQLWLESLGTNPTLLSTSGGDAREVPSGELCRIAPGDRIALMCQYPHQAVEVQFEADAEPGAATAELQPEGAGWSGANERPRARRKLAEPPASSPDTLAAAPAAAGAWPVMLLLAGPPGSGKSTFALALQHASPPGSWHRVCQDVVRHGNKRGTRPQCVAAAQEALARGMGVIIDRCNFDAEQRADFVALARRRGVPVHCLVLQLPADLAAKRAVERTAHEGGVQGKGAAVVSKRMSGMMRKAGPPSRGEGFASVRVCKADAEVSQARADWIQWAQSHRPGASTETREEGTPSAPSAPPPPPAASPATGQDALARMMAAARAERRGSRPPAPPPPRAPTSPPRVIQFHGHWADALRRVAMQPERFREEYPEMELLPAPGDPAPHPGAVLVYDKYPKARRHALVVSTNPELQSIEELRHRHLPELRHMEACGRAWAARQPQGAGVGEFQLGFHWLPSMRQLHLHVVSRDFCSDALKHKKHWNSFTTAFFRPVGAITEELEANGRVHIDIEEAKRLLAAPLRCHRCAAPQKDMPTLKAHIRGCAAGNNG